MTKELTDELGKGGIPLSDIEVLATIHGELQRQLNGAEVAVEERVFVALYEVASRGLLEPLAEILVRELITRRRAQLHARRAALTQKLQPNLTLVH